MHEGARLEHVRRTALSTDLENARPHGRAFFLFFHRVGALSGSFFRTPVQDRLQSAQPQEQLPQESPPQEPPQEQPRFLKICRRAKKTAAARRTRITISKGFIRLPSLKHADQQADARTPLRTPPCE